MLVVDPTIAGREWHRVTEEIERILSRNGATTLQVAKWGERKLAYPIRKNNRGAYVLAYFAAPHDTLTRIKADLQLSEIIMRSLLLRHEGELRKEPPKDFETAGPLPPRTDRRGPHHGACPGGFGGGRPGGHHEGRR
jgi:small subunit ribosomal protein S6